MNADNTAAALASLTPTDRRVLKHALTERVRRAAVLSGEPDGPLEAILFAVVLDIAAGDDAALAELEAMYDSMYGVGDVGDDDGGLS